MNTLCFSGGGIRGIAFAGALSYLESINNIKLENINTFIGTSIGAVYATLLALKYDITDIIDFILHFNFEILFPSINCDNILQNYGLCNNKKIKITIEHFIKSKFEVNDLTFLELYNLTQNKLIITGADITNAKVDYFNYIDNPDMSILTAIEITSAIPILFNPVLYNNNYYVDAGFVNNYPMNYCNKNTTLGFHVKQIYFKIDSILSVISASISMTTACQKYNNTIEIIINDISPLNFNINYDQKLDLINIGREAAKKYIEKNNIIIDNNKFIQTDNSTNDQSTQTDTIHNDDSTDVIQNDDSTVAIQNDDSTIAIQNDGLTDMHNKV
jgi:predicted acylesterase/phospholipase RssA